jgi:hypothetical protein
MKVWVVFLVAAFLLGVRAAKRGREVSPFTLLGLCLFVAAGLYTYGLV